MPAIKVLRIEVDGHLRGMADVPRPWVARIKGIDPRYGLAREFVDRLNDWSDARRARSGNLYGVVAAFPLRAGELYEVSRLRGRASKRHLAREFLRVVDGRMEDVEPIDALAIAEGWTGASFEHRVPDYTSISVVDGLGSPTALGFVLVDGRRLYRMRDEALHEVVDPDGGRRLVVASAGRVSPISHLDALLFLQRKHQTTGAVAI